MFLPSRQSNQQLRNMYDLRKMQWTAKVGRQLLTKRWVQRRKWSAGLASKLTDEYLAKINLFKPWIYIIPIWIWIILQSFSHLHMTILAPWSWIIQTYISLRRGVTYALINQVIHGLIKPIIYVHHLITWNLHSLFPFIQRIYIVYFLERIHTIVYSILL
jgi:hypothetical protein